MRTHLHRRDFLAASALAGAGILAGGPLSAIGAAEGTEAKEQPRFTTTPHKALIGGIGPNTEKTFEAWKAVGIEGMEAVGKNALTLSPVEAAKYHSMAERLGMRIHSVMYGWANVNDKDSGNVARDIDSITTALGACQGYGADALLLVPCKITGMKVPKQWEFDIRFDEKTGHVKQVVAGDNSPYEEYIEAHNRSTDAARKAINKLIPVAQKTGVVIAIENVWNNLWVKPDIFANFIRSFNCHWVQAYYDIANHVVYAPPLEWIRALGELIVKIHVKDFRLNPNGQGGSWINIRENGVDWPAIRAELDKINYSGWMTLEGSGRLPLEEKAKRLDLILAGK